MRKLYAFILAVLLVLGLSAAVYAEDGVSETYGGYQVVTVAETFSYSNGSAVGDAYCPDESWRVTGGGYFVESFRAVVVDNRDVDGAPNSEPDSWHVTATSQAGGAIVPNGTELTVRAICTKLG